MCKSGIFEKIRDAIRQRLCTCYVHVKSEEKRFKIRGYGKIMIYLYTDNGCLEQKEENCIAKIKN